jgi:type IV pilus assembly protein PilA
MRVTPRCARGFTLIELMVSVAIVGLLSSVALPQYTRATLRARAAERETVMESLSRAVNDIVMAQQRVPGPACVSGNPCTMSAVANPPGTPGTSKRKFDWTLAVWRELPMVVDGDAYYSYSFVATDATGDGKDVTLSIVGQGDLDGDGITNVKTMTFTGIGYSFKLTSEVPARGQENGGTF